MVEIMSAGILDEDLFEDDPEGVHDESNASKNGNKKKDSKRRRNRNNNKKKQPAVTNQRSNIDSLTSMDHDGEAKNETDKENDDIKIEIELVPEEVELDKNYAEFARIFDRFKFNSSGVVKTESEDTKVKAGPVATGKAAELERLNALRNEEEEEEEREKKERGSQQAKLSKKKLKQQTRLSVAALKQLVQRPDVVEMHDVTAIDPKLLVYLKAIRNSVPVPRHWCAKRKYLQGKRGFEKPAFDLPDFIKRTGIQSMREAVQEKDRNKSLKQKMREKVRPKTGRVDIDYQKLHDAFFRWQTKPRMSTHGDLYYEGKELETRLKEKKPGNMTDDLRIALGMPTGPNSDKVPPPWLIAMQRYGPPPSYPSLKIPGLNAPIPEGCSFGYHAGGWGKPPVDEFGRPLYGDVFGSTSSDMRKPLDEEPVDQSLWGEMEDEVYEVMPDELDQEEDEDEEEEAKEGEAEGETEAEEAEMDTDEATAGLKTPGEGLITPSGISTGMHSAGLETPDMIELRKRKHQIESDMEGSGDGEAPVLYKVLPEKASSIGASMMGSSKVYDLSAAKKVTAAMAESGGIDMALNPDELDMDADVLQSRFDAQMRQQQSRSELDGGDTTGDEPSRRAKKKKAEEEAAAKLKQQQQQAAADKDKSKKYKEFKF